MKPVHRESNLDIDYVISYKIPADGPGPSTAMAGSMLTAYRPNKCHRPVQDLDPISGRGRLADGSTQWHRHFPPGLRQGWRRESIRGCCLQVEVSLRAFQCRAPAKPQQNQGLAARRPTSPARSEHTESSARRAPHRCRTIQTDIPHDYSHQRRRWSFSHPRAGRMEECRCHIPTSRP